jgi:6-phosphogluconate dehydrogenase
MLADRLIEESAVEQANFGFMGLGVMGHMLALNMERHGFRVAMFDVTPGKVKSIAEKHPGGLHRGARASTSHHDDGASG